MPNRPRCTLHGRGGLNRRELLQIGASGLLGVGLPGLIGQAAGAGDAPGRAKAKSVLLIFLAGGLSHVDSFDMKPDAPEGYRSEFKPVATRVPGVRICEHLPGLAARLDRLAVVRSMTSPRAFGGHHHATHGFLTGIDRLPAGSVESPTRHDWPHYAAGLDYCRPRPDGLPSGVLLPRMVADGTLGIYSGQTAGFLGARHDPWFLAVDPNGTPGSDGGFSLPPGLSVDRFRSREALLADLDRQRGGIDRAGAQGLFSEHQARAFRVLASSRLSEALRLDREPAAVRDRYGRHLYGQSLLLARRLLQAGVPVVQANMAEYFSQWDTHTRNFETLKKILPPLDRAVSALLDDMGASGLLDETLVILTGEFGRTPRMGGFVGTSSFSPDGRDHWLDCFTTAFAGGGVRGGQVIGGSDKVGAFATTRTYTLPDLGATVYSALGVDPATPIKDIQGRPYRLNEGEPIAAIYG